MINRALGITVLSYQLLTGCGLFPESSFALAIESRLPRWFALAHNQTRADVTVTMDYYTDTSTTFTLRDSSGNVISKVKGRNKTLEPLRRKEKQSGYPEGYPSYEIIAVGEITEIIEHRNTEPTFYVTDDPAVLAELADHG
jgi:hypothetical protein